MRGRPVICVVGRVGGCPEVRHTLLSYDDPIRLESNSLYLPVEPLEAVPEVSKGKVKYI